MTFQWEGVFPAVTTKFRPDEQIDAAAMEKHLSFQIDSGVHGLVLLGSLGEQGTLSPEEKLLIVRLGKDVSRGRVPVIAAVAETTTARACAFVEQAATAGADGFMLLPPMQYPSDERETLQYYRAVARASDRPIMIYNNPIAYRVDLTPPLLAELADESKFQAIKESSGDIRRITDIANLLGNRYRLFSGVDDLALESLVLGAAGWVAGLVCAFPRETVAIYSLVRVGRIAEALPIYRWFTPLLHLDTDVKFIHYIKLAESLVGVGTETMRAPRLPLTGEERERITAIIRHALQTRPSLPEL